MKFFVSKFNNSLVCTDGFNFDKLQNNKIYEVTVRTYRNILFHRKFFGLLNKFCEANGIDNVDNFRKVYTMKAGYYDIVETPKGAAYLPQSINFEKMNNEDFEHFYNSFNEVLFNDFGCNLDDIENTTKY